MKITAIRNVLARVFMVVLTRLSISLCRKHTSQYLLTATHRFWFRAYNSYLKKPLIATILK